MKTTDLLIPNPVFILLLLFHFSGGVSMLYPTFGIKALSVFLSYTSEHLADILSNHMTGDKNSC